MIQKRDSKQEYAIEVRDITKHFKIYLDRGTTLKEKTLFSKRRRYENRDVLKGVSFQVKKGEAVGLIGHNGCGKSTTLKLLTGIIYPDQGDIKMHGRVSSLIELGAGFHPDMSGRENIYINASIFGLSRKEIDQKIDDIISFSELEEFIDNPVRTYSSGMYMRLAFSVAINVNAEILLVDEILAVGDVSFQAKCFNKMREIKRQGTTIVIVSHSMDQIEQICDRSIWIHEGLVKAEGIPREVNQQYLDFMAQERQKQIEKEAQREAAKRAAERAARGEEEEEPEEQEIDPRVACAKIRENEDGSRDMGNLWVEMDSVTLYNQEGQESHSFRIGDDITVAVKYHRNNEEIKDSAMGIHIYRNDGTDCYGTNTLIDKMDNLVLADKGEVRIKLRDVHLLRGRYEVEIAFHDDTGITYNHRFRAAYFEMLSTRNEVGSFRIDHQWIL